MAANKLSGGIIWEWGERGSGARLVRIENAWREGEGGAWSAVANAPVSQVC